MATISLNRIPAFDAGFDFSVSFKYSGNQAVKNRLIVYEDLTNESVYDEIAVTQMLSHMIPAGTLINGKNYNCTITAYDINNAETVSSPVSFVCKTKPLWQFNNMPSDNIIRNSSFAFDLHYSQSESEVLNEYKVTVLTSADSVFWTTGNIVNSTVQQVTVRNLFDDGIYYIRAEGRTQNGMILDTGNIQFTVSFNAPTSYSHLSLENKKYEGIVKVSSNIIMIEGKSNPDEILYVDIDSPHSKDGVAVDVRREGHWVSFDEGYDLDGSFWSTLIGFGFTQNKEFLRINDENGYVSLYWRKGIFANGVKNYVELRSNHEPVYVVFSNKINPVKSLNLIKFQIRRCNGLYEIRISDFGKAISVNYDFEMKFDMLDGKIISNGIWNQALERLEC